jgi:hypothetical protein
MKTNILTIAFVLACLAKLPGQTTAIPNDGFENALSLDYDILSNYEGSRNSNPASLIKTGQLTMWKTADAANGTYAIELQTASRGLDTAYGYITNANPATDPGSGGIPYAESPTAVTGFYKCNIPAGDTGVFILAFKSQGNYLGIAIQKFYGTVSAYTQFTIPVNLPLSPDTIIFTAASSNILMSNFNGLIGSTLQLDNISLSGVNAQPANMNSDFELWRDAHYTKVLNWQSQGDSVQLSTDSNSGNYALQLQVEDINGAAFADNVTSGTYSLGGPIGGNPYFLMKDSLIGYYKLFSNGGDSGYITASFSRQGNLIGAVAQALPPASSYTRFAVPISLTSMPDSIRVDISAAYFITQPAQIGSILLVDDIHLFSESLSTPVQKVPDLKNQLTIYPNPVTNTFRITGNTGSDESALLSIYSDTGSLVYKQDIRNKGLASTNVSLADFPKGVYFLRFEQAGKVFSQKVILQ